MSDIRYMMRLHEQLFERLKVAEAMRAFISQPPGGVDKLGAQLEKIEAELAFAQEAVSDGAERLCRVEEEREAIRAEADSLRKKKKKPWRAKSMKLGRKTFN